MISDAGYKVLSHIRDSEYAALSTTELNEYCREIKATGKLLSEFSARGFIRQAYNFDGKLTVGYELTDLGRAEIEQHELTGEERRSDKLRYWVTTGIATAALLKACDSELCFLLDAVRLLFCRITER